MITQQVLGEQQGQTKGTFHFTKNNKQGSKNRKYGCLVVVHGFNLSAQETEAEGSL